MDSLQQKEAEEEEEEEDIEWMNRSQWMHSKPNPV
jgi:hypothetical protein